MQETGRQLDPCGDVAELISSALAAEDVALIIAGLPHNAKIGQQLRAAAAADPRIRVRLELIPPADVPDLFAAADVAVLPRDDGGTSGALILALDMGVPVIAAKLPATIAIAASGMLASAPMIPVAAALPAAAPSALNKGLFRNPMALPTGPI